DGIRDFHVTGVQTCALPISWRWVPLDRRAFSWGVLFTPRRRLFSNTLALASIHLVTSLCAGPPLGGLYLKPPSPGGLCEGVTTRSEERREGEGVAAGDGRSA